LNASYRRFRGELETLVRSQGSWAGLVDTVAVSGEPARVIDGAQTVDSTIVEVELPAQPNGSGGYVGFMDAANVGEDARSRVTHVVREFGTCAVAVEGAGFLVDLAAGTTVELLDLESGHVAVVLLVSGVRVRCPLRGLRPLEDPLSPTEIFDVAKGFMGVPYVWGGTERSGIDCSGLVHMAARIGGRLIPRDAHHQWAATRGELSWSELAVGDLLYFGDSASLADIVHVGMYAGGGRMLHAPEEGRTVALEPISTRARARTVGFGRIGP
jgi:hypothetical protein